MNIRKSTYSFTDFKFYVHKPNAITFLTHFLLFIAFTEHSNPKIPKRKLPRITNEDEENKKKKKKQKRKELVQRKLIRKHRTALKLSSIQF